MLGDKPDAGTAPCNSDESVGCVRNGDNIANGTDTSNTGAICVGNQTLHAEQNAGGLCGDINQSCLELQRCSRNVLVAPSFSGSANSDPDYNFASSHVSTRENQPTPTRVTQPCPNNGENTPNCAVCNTTCSSLRTCSRCGNFIHHFCSHDVCISLEIRGPDGQLVEDFGENSYCSKKCYEETTSPEYCTASNTVYQPRSESNFSSPNSAVSMISAQHKKSAVKSAQVQPTRTNQTSHGPSRAKQLARVTTPKTGAQKKKDKSPKTMKVKRKTLAAGMKDELTRIARLTADIYMEASVAFAPAKEDWMQKRLYREAGTSYLLGHVTQYNIDTARNIDGILVPTAAFQIRWTCTAFQKNDHVHKVSEAVVVRGIQNFTTLQKGSLHFGETWTSLCSAVPQLTNIAGFSDDYEELDEQGYREWSVFRGQKELQIPLTTGEVEAIQSMTFSKSASLVQSPGLYTHEDGSTLTKLREDSHRYFGHSATSSFFAFIPLSFWNQVVQFSNENADAGGSPSSQEISLDELMKFLGILWYMTLFDKGEMRNYWVDDDDAGIFPGASFANLEVIMTWRRFIYVRKNLCFRSNVTAMDIQRDPVAWIRPLINMLKSRSARHVILGRNVAVDEASIACRSQYARHLIVFNSQKPTGKYHFKLYVCCCSTSWYVSSFKLHCASEIQDRLNGVVQASEVSRLAEMTESSSEVRSHVIEVTASLQGSGRIVNTDNYYTSCQLLGSLRSMGLYGRGTVRSSSQHFPRFTVIKKNDERPRGFTKQGVCLEKHIVAASWVDGSIVNIVSNADASTSSTVYRRIKDAKVAFSAPTCIGEYNSAMQGVDRHDQLRGRFSLADGHSFQKWHKKLAMAIIDIARCNAYVCRNLASDVSDSSQNGDDTSTSGPRDKHRAVVRSLVRELFNGDWKKTIDNTNGMVYAISPVPAPEDTPSPAERDSKRPIALPPVCVGKEASIALNDRSRAKRKCTICKFEGRYPTQKTDYCEMHRVALCKRTYPVDAAKSHLCQQEDWTCWQKYHYFYLPKHVFTVDGNLKRTSVIYKTQAPFLKELRKKSQSSSE